MESLNKHTKKAKELGVSWGSVGSIGHFSHLKFTNLFETREQTKQSQATRKIKVLLYCRSVPRLKNYLRNFVFPKQEAGVDRTLATEIPGTF